MLSPEARRFVDEVEQHVRPYYPYSVPASDFVLRFSDPLENLKQAFQDRGIVWLFDPAGDWIRQKITFYIQ